MKIDNNKEEMTHDMENLREKNEIEIQNTMEGPPAELKKWKTEYQNLKTKWKLKEKLNSY
jgi:hypothetical protein